MLMILDKIKEIYNLMHNQKYEIKKSKHSLSPYHQNNLQQNLKNKLNLNLINKIILE